MMDGLIHKDPANAVWKFRRALAASRYAQVQLRRGNVIEAERSTGESLAVLLPLAEKPDAGPRVLSIAADALVNLRPTVKEDVSLAVSFAQRALQDKPQPEAEDYLLLAAAQRRAGHVDEAKHAAEDALRVTPVRSNSVSDAKQRASATSPEHPRSRTASCFLFTVTDSEGKPANATQAYTISTVLPKLTITSGNFDDCNVGVLCEGQYEATGGKPPYTWAIAPGTTFPAGLTLSAAGVFSGKPTQYSVNGNYELAVQVTDSEDPPVKVTDVSGLKVVSGLKIVSIPLPTAIIGVGY